MKRLLTVRSTIHPKMIQKTLFRGVFLGFIGILIILYAGIAIPAPTLRFWGFPLFILGIGLITVGLIPYRRLTRLESRPDELVITDSGYLEFVSKGVVQMHIPIGFIEKMQYLKRNQLYGIGVGLMPGQGESQIVFHPNFDISSFQKRAKRFGVNLFFPFFSERSAKELEENILGGLDEDEESPRA